ncbi:TonB-linked SusC/RagA family outer membrane protein [Mangrovibacterium diazotrophicum]|uniref:TonB-linked SusC/RagA family outer membrane protein n=2 Tax=Mangrovibacterium diazotrophicum TaxID=1261403 RepID=A0A419W5L5_9BACT|nr:TonB-linked SusC/RagA family outer membrane protein [Mangrovibacterium diazotrophicum]
MKKNWIVRSLLSPHVKMLLRIMKLTFVFVVLLSLTVSASVYSQQSKFSLNLKNVSIREVLRQVEEQTQYKFLLQDERLNIDEKVNVNVDQANIEALLEEVFVNQKVKYTITDKNLIIITPSTSKNSGQAVQQQTGKVTGLVTDAAGSPLPGVTVVLKGTTTGTITDFEGRYTIGGLTSESVLLFSFVGMGSQEFTVGESPEINVVMREDAVGLDEVVAIGYGSQSKRNITGAIQNIETEDLESIPTAQLTQKLQGKLAGVQINQTTGIPGQGMSIRIRGQASISAGNDPLYVVDGFPLTGDIANINPDEIESISVLKDASSTALYGSRAANGVVLITTKQAKFGKSSMSVSAYAGVQMVPEKGRPDMMNAREFAKFKKEIFEENGWSVPEMYQNPDQYGEGTDWFDAVTRAAVIQNYSVSYSTSKDKFKSSVVAGYFDQEGILLNSDYKRFSLRVNSEYKFNDKVKVGVNVSNTVTTNNTPQSDGIWYNSPSIVQSAILTSPLAPYINEDGTIPVNTGTWSGTTGETGTYGTSPGPNWYNQVQIVKNKTKNIGLLATGFVEYEPITGLKYKSSIGVDLGNNVNDFFYPAAAGSIFNPGNPDDASRIYATHSNSYGYSWLWENTLTYNKEINDHNFEVLAGYTAQRAHGESGYLYGTGFPDDRVQTLNAATTITGNTDIQDWALASLISRINYNYKNRYLVSLAYRRDGSSRFGSQNRWGDFPSGSLGWVASEEGFMSAVPQISFLKLRGSWGVTGNNNIGNYTQYSNIVDTNNPVNGVITNGKSLAGLNNEDLGWENTTEVDFGLDLGLFDNRISVTYDYFRRITDNLLYTVDIPISSGFYSFTTNVGKIKLWGHEVTINTKNLTGKFKWDTDFNIAFNRNEALELGTTNATIYGDYTITEVGQPLGQLYGLEWDGLYYTQEEVDAVGRQGAEVGTIKFKDQDGDGWVYNDDRDKTVLGSAAPKAIYGLTNTFYYKNFDLAVVCQGAYGHKIFNLMDRFAANLDGNFNVYKAVDRRWRSADDPGDGKYGKVKSGTTGYERDWAGSQWLYDASYFTIKNITLGYNLPLKRINNIKSVRVYGSIQQAFVFTKYPGNNPEVSAAGGINSGADATTYPVPRTFTFGLNLNF